MDIKRRVMPLVVTGAISLAAVGVPVFAVAGSDGSASEAQLTQAEVQAQADADKAAEEAAAQAAAEQAAEEAAARAAEQAAAEQAAAEQAAAEQAAAEQAAQNAEPTPSETDFGEGGEGSSSGDADNSSTEGNSDDSSNEGSGGTTDASGDNPADNPGDDPSGEPGDDPSGEPGDNPSDEPSGDDPASDPSDDPADTPAADDSANDSPAADTPAKDAGDDTDKDGTDKDAADTGKKEASGAADDKNAAATSTDASDNADADADKDQAAKSDVQIDGAEVKQAMAEVAEALLDNSFQSAFVGQSYTPVWHSSYLSTDIFIASIGEQARQIAQENNLYASVMIAQAIIESDSGNSGLAQAPNNNLFGIKGSYEGKSVNMSTQEDNGAGNLYTIRSDFRKYPTQRESLEDYAKLLRNDEAHYGKAWRENAGTYQDAAKALQGTYATSTVYASSICAVIDAYDLTRFDRPADFKITSKSDDGTALTMADYTNLQALAVSYLGMPYTWGGDDPETGFDCSGFVQYLYKEALGIDLTRTTYTQQHEGTEVKLDDLRMGDLLFFSEGGDTYHVALYLGDGFYIHAPEPGDVIKVSTMESFTPTFAKRIIETQPA